jgi:hypothetical protein
MTFYKFSNQYVQFPGDFPLIINRYLIKLI